jgi:hypothetical protein
MSDREEGIPMEQLLAAIAEDWRLLQDVKQRLPQRIALALARGASGHRIRRDAGVPERTVRRMRDRATNEKRPGPGTRNAGPGLDLNPALSGETR